MIVKKRTVPNPAALMPLASRGRHIMSAQSYESLNYLSSRIEFQISTTKMSVLVLLYWVPANKFPCILVTNPYFDKEQTVCARILAIMTHMLVLGRRLPFWKLLRFEHALNTSSLEYSLGMVKIETFFGWEVRFISWFLNIWIAYGSWENTHQTDLYHFLESVFYFLWFFCVWFSISGNNHFAIPHAKRPTNVTQRAFHLFDRCPTNLNKMKNKMTQLDARFCWVDFTENPK